jgi:hypothetical protein
VDGGLSKEVDGGDEVGRERKVSLYMYAIVVKKKDKFKCAVLHDFFRGFYISSDAALLTPSEALIFFSSRSPKFCAL